MEQIKKRLLPQIGNIIFAQYISPCFDKPKIAHAQLREIIEGVNNDLGIRLAGEVLFAREDRVARIIAPNRDILYIDPRLLQEWEEKFKQMSKAPRVANVKPEIVSIYQRLLGAYAEPVKDVMFE